MIFPFLKTLFLSLRRGPATRRYPRVVRTPFPGTRGHLVNDAGKCIFCGVCARRCPAGALVVTRTPAHWTLDPYRCIVCGYCVEVCPKKSLRMEPWHRRESGGARGQG
ncbi:MAG: 4Fe-4S binding protein [bacterium]|nr:4Fe-4S binding protein [bacterium]